MKLMRIVAAASLILVVLFAAGCGLKPSPGIPSNLTAGYALESISRQAGVVKDIDGWGRARSTEGSSVRTAKVSVKFILPHLFKSVILGFAGIELATVASDGDSLTAYIPALDGYFRTGLETKALSAIIPLAGAGLDELLPLISGSPPVPSSLDMYEKELKRRGRNAEVTLRNDGSAYTYLLTGPNLRVVGFSLATDGEKVCTVRWKNFEDIGGIAFPKSVTVETKRGEVAFEWSSFILNTGLEKTACVFIVPHDARRLFPRPSVR